MGVALASEACRRGHPTTLLLGPVGQTGDLPEGVQVERFESTQDLQQLLKRHMPQHAMLIMAAAVADFIPRTQAEGKLSRRNGPLTLTLEPAPDLLAQLAAGRRPGQHMVGFALESAHQLEQAATEKMARKGIDAIVANPLETMESETITASVLFADGPKSVAPPDLPKGAFAAWLMDLLEARFSI